MTQTKMFPIDRQDVSPMMSTKTKKVSSTTYSIVDPQQEFDFDVQGIPNRPTTDGQAAREIKENLEEAEGLIEFGKPGSPFENGIKNYKQLNAVLTASV